MWFLWIIAGLYIVWAGSLVIGPIRRIMPGGNAALAWLGRFSDYQPTMLPVVAIGVFLIFFGLRRR